MTKLAAFEVEVGSQKTDIYPSLILKCYQQAFIKKAIRWSKIRTYVVSKNKLFIHSVRLFSEAEGWCRGLCWYFDMVLISLEPSTCSVNSFSLTNKTSGLQICSLLFLLRYYKQPSDQWELGQIRAQRPTNWLTDHKVSALLIIHYNKAERQSIINKPMPPLIKLSGSSSSVSLLQAIPFMPHAVRYPSCL